MSTHEQGSHRYGFGWGPVDVQRMSTFDRGQRGRTYVLRVNDLHIYVSPTGRTRVFRQRKRGRSVELKPSPAKEG